jgi:hypothetical protein
MSRQQDENPGIPRAKAVQNSYEERQFDKDMDSRMLPGDKELYLGGLQAARQEKDQVMQEVEAWWMDHSGAPPQEMDRQWKARLARAEQAEIRMKTYRPFFEGRYDQYFKQMDRIGAGGEASTAGSFAVAERGGVFETLLGQKASGAIGWLTPEEILATNANSPGIDERGMAKNINFPVNVNYTGDFSKFVNTTLESASQYLVPTAQGVSSRAEDVGSESVRFMQDILSRTNEPDLTEAAGKLYQVMPRSAKEDLMSNHFFQDLLSVGYDPQDKTGKRLVMPFGQASGMGLRFNEQESEVVSKYMNGQGLTTAERAVFGKIQQDYAREMILAMSPVKRRVTQEARLTKIFDRGTGEGDEKKGFYTMISQDELGSQSPATVLIRNDNVLSENTPMTRAGQPLLRRWTDINPTERARFNDDAVTLLKEASGLDPTYFSGMFNFFYTQKGQPNRLSVLRDTHSAVIGLTGRVQENFIPDSDDKGLSPIEVSHTTKENLEKRKVLTVEVEVAVPDDTVGDFEDQVRELYGVKTDNIDKDDLLPKSFLVYEDGEKLSKDYHLIKLWMPVSRDMLPYLDDPTRYSKGTYQARKADAENQLRQRKISNISLKQYATR